MKYIILIFLKTTIFALASSFDDCQKENPKWLECKESSDCVVISNPCGHPMAVANKKYSKDAEKCNIQKGAVLDCVIWNEKRDGKAQAVCLKGSCTTKLNSSDSAKNPPE